MNFKYLCENEAVGHGRARLLEGVQRFYFDCVVTVF